MKDIFDLESEMIDLVSKIQESKISCEEALIILERLLEDYKFITRIEESKFLVLKKNFTFSILKADRLNRLESSVIELEYRLNYFNKKLELI